MRSKKIYVLTILLMFFLTVSCAYANEGPMEDATVLSADANEVVVSSPIDEELVDSTPILATASNENPDDSTPVLSEINYDDLIIKDINFTGDSSKLFIEGFSQNGLVMSDFTMSIIPSSDASKVELNMNIPDVKYTDYNNIMFVFKNLDLSILPSSDPSALDFSAIMDSLDLISEDAYVNLRDLKLFFKSYPEVNGVSIAIAMSDFAYSNLKDTSFNFQDLDFNMALGLEGQALYVNVIMPTLKLINENNGVNLTDLDLSIILPDTKLANLDISILMSDFKYTNFDDVTLNMTDLDLSLVPILNSTSFNTIMSMSSFNFTGINSSDFQFPGFSITGIDFENFTTGLDLSKIDLSGVVSILDVSNMDLSTLVSYLSSGFDITTYTDNMPGQYESSLDFNAIDLSSIDLSGVNVSSIDLAKLFTTGDFSSLNSSVLNLTGLFDAFGINVSDFGIDMSSYNMSAINISDISSILNNPDFNMSAITSKLNLTNLDLGGIDISKLISSFNMSSFDLSLILGMFNLTGFNLTEFFKNFDLQKLLNLFMKNNSDSNKTVPDTPVVPASKNAYYPVKAYNTAQRTYTVTRLSDYQIICKAHLFILEYLNKLFNLTFINGHLKVYIDGELVFEGDTGDDLTLVIFEIIEKYLGEHEVKVEFTDRDNKTNTYKEKIIVE